jgi:hypothetical protein
MGVHFVAQIMPSSSFCQYDSGKQSDDIYSGCGVRHFSRQYVAVKQALTRQGSYFHRRSRRMTADSGSPLILIGLNSGVGETDPFPGDAVLGVETFSGTV